MGKKGGSRRECDPCPIGGREKNPRRGKGTGKGKAERSRRKKKGGGESTEGGKNKGEGKGKDPSMFSKEGEKKKKNPYLMTRKGKEENRVSPEKFREVSGKKPLPRKKKKHLGIQVGVSLFLYRKSESIRNKNGETNKEGVASSLLLHERGKKKGKEKTVVPTSHQGETQSGEARSQRGGKREKEHHVREREKKKRSFIYKNFTSLEKRGYERRGEVKPAFQERKKKWDACLIGEKEKKKRNFLIPGKGREGTGWRSRKGEAQTQG